MTERPVSFSVAIVAAVVGVALAVYLLWHVLP